MTREVDATMKTITTGVAVSGVTMPVWMPTLEEVSGLAETLVPILSAMWLIVQIINYARKRGSQ